MNSINLSNDPDSFTEQIKWKDFWYLWKRVIPVITLITLKLNKIKLRDEIASLLIYSIKEN